MRRNLMQIFFLIIGSLLTLDGLVMGVVSNFNVGILLTLFSGLFFLAWGIIYKKIRASKSVLLKVIKCSAAVGYALLLACMIFLAAYGMSGNATYTEDAVIVLGAGVHGDRPSKPLVQRLERAKEYYDKNKNAVIVVSGAKGFQENLSEAEAMKRYLTERGVPEDAIIKEEKATSTYENMKYSKEILDSLFDGEYKAVVITNDFHIFRAMQLAKNAGIDGASHLGAPTSWYNLPPCYLRECLAVVKLFLIGR